MSSDEGRRVTARWNGTVVATSTATITVEGNRYFPPEDVRWEHLRASARTYRVAFWHGVTVSQDAEVASVPPAAPSWTSA